VFLPCLRRSYIIYSVRIIKDRQGGICFNKTQTFTSNTPGSPRLASTMNQLLYFRRTEIMITYQTQDSKFVPDLLAINLANTSQRIYGIFCLLLSIICVALNHPHCFSRPQGPHRFSQTPRIICNSIYNSAL